MSRVGNVMVQQLQGAFRRLPTRREEATLTFRKVVPNACTLLALVVGLSTVPLALARRFEAAVVCVFVAGKAKLCLLCFASGSIAVVVLRVAFFSRHQTTLNSSLLY